MSEEEYGDPDLNMTVMFADSGQFELRQIPFNYQGFQMFFNFHEEADLTLAGVPGDMASSEIVDGLLLPILDYIRDAISSEEFRESLDNRNTTE